MLDTGQDRYLLTYIHIYDPVYAPVWPVFGLQTKDKLNNLAWSRFMAESGMVWGEYGILADISGWAADSERGSTPGIFGAGRVPHHPSGAQSGFPILGT